MKAKEGALVDKKMRQSLALKNKEEKAKGKYNLC